VAIPEASLEDAAQNVFSDTYVFWLTGQLKAKTTTFYTNAFANADLDPQTVSHQPLLNWFASLGSYLQAVTESGAASMSQYELYQLENILYRLLWMATFSNDENMITNAQGAAILAAFNAAYI
jgi:hypothetical protein